MRVTLWGCASRDRLAAREPEIDVHAIQIALPMALVRRFDSHATTPDIGREPLELRRALAYSRLDGRRAVDVVEYDLKRHLHGLSR
jgi:hypothetical protein